MFFLVHWWGEKPGCSLSNPPMQLVFVWALKHHRKPNSLLWQTKSSALILNGGNNSWIFASFLLLNLLLTTWIYFPSALLGVPFLLPPFSDPLPSQHQRRWRGLSCHLLPLMSLHLQMEESAKAYHGFQMSSAHLVLYPGKKTNNVLCLERRVPLTKTAS